MFSARDLGTGQENDRNVIPTVTVVTADSGSINFILAPLGWVPAPSRRRHLQLTSPATHWAVGGLLVLMLAACSFKCVVEPFHH